MPIAVTVLREGTTLDLLLWRAHGQRGVTAPLLAAGFSLNPGLAALGPVLPVGRQVLLPDLPPEPASPPRRPAVSLFD